MQVFKKIGSLFVIFFLAGCTATFGTGKVQKLDTSSISEKEFGSATEFRVGMLLPLSGSAAKQGEGLRNATLLALEDLNNPNMMLQFYDTKSTPGGARIAIENALSQKAQMIIGPLTSAEVLAITPAVKKKEIPVLTFSTNADVLDDGIYSLGLMVGEQVDRMVTYAASKKHKKIALLVPDNNTGITVARSAIISAEKNDAKVVRIGFYPPNITNFTGILNEVTDYEKRSNRIKTINAKLNEQAKNGNVNAQKILTRLKGIDTLGDLDFDTIIIPETGQRLKAATSMLSYYDAAAPKVKILGTSLWGNSSINRENSLEKGWYPSITNKHNKYFINRYNEVFGEIPNNLYTFAYDAVALAAIATRSQEQDIVSIITRPDGYAGINGAFRIFYDGTNQHALDIIEVHPEGNKIIDPAPEAFSEEIEYTDFSIVRYDEDFIAPQIFGKERILAQTEIFASELPIENQYIAEEIDEAMEAEIIRKALAKYRIYLP